MIPFANILSFLTDTSKGALLTLVPWVLVFYGPKIRARSKFASVCSSFSCTPPNHLLTEFRNF